MTKQSSGLDNHIFLYKTSDTGRVSDLHQLIENHISDVKLIQTIEELLECLHTDTLQSILIVTPVPSNEIITTLKDTTPDHVTKILVTLTDTPYSKDDDTTFDFTLPYNQEFINNFKRLYEFLCQQVQRSLHDKQIIHQLETQLKQQKEQSSQLEILKEAIVRNVSHELKTPLLHVKSAVSLLSEDIGKDNKLIRYAENATARLETLVTNITMFSSSLDLNLGPVIVTDTIEYAYRNLRRTWEIKEQAKRIEFDIPSDLPPVLADRQGLSTIMQLLLDNALKFSEDRIEVKARIVDQMVEISIRDYGIGIDQAHIENIFDSFYQIDPSSTRRYGGTGVGLALVKLLLEKHNSRIQVESEPNKGSTFSFKLHIINLE